MWKKESEEGSVIIIVAVSMVIILSLCALALDLESVYLKGSKLQDAVDASVLAAAQDLPDTYKATGSVYKYIQLNGFDPSDVSISFLDSNKAIKVTATKKIEYLFAKCIGFSDTTITRSASGMIETMGGAFDYALFSGDRYSALSLSGSSFYIKGSTHSNQNFKLSCSSATITGTCEAVSTISIHGSSINVEDRMPNASEVDMPDFSDTIKSNAENANQVYYSSQSFNSTDVNVDGAIYVYGDVSFNASSFNGKGTICATGNITFNGSNINASSEDAVCFYSKEGNITVNGSSVSIDGILYAPQGKIKLSASSININGRVIGNKLDISGSTINITSGTKELNCLPSSSKLIQ